ncbi:MAG: hypothetical protein JWN76_2924 [Chitinophagaceae bacterium]|nr:hypothetical protein [Chitinophagaceae bacterium]
MRKLFYLLFIFLPACASHHSMQVLRTANNEHVITGTDFYHIAAAFDWKRRDSFAMRESFNGNFPSFMKKFVPVTSSVRDSSGHLITVVYYVSPDYWSIGSDDDWARIPLTPVAAQAIADSFNCFLPTRKMVDDIYKQAKVKLEPVPMYAFRDSTVTMWQHHLIIEGQRKGREGLIAGIKKDIVISGKITRDTKPYRVAIYGWHKLDGKAIQPLYTGHVNWYADYSHGVRLIYREVWVNGKEMDYIDVLKHPVYHLLLCDEADCDVYRYNENYAPLIQK